MNSLLLDALQFQNRGRAPVWLMRQAGRYIPEYQKLREKHSLWQLFHEPELAAEVTRLPLKLMPLDAAILFSDITLIAECFGWNVQFPDNKGPVIDFSLDRCIQKPVAETLQYIAEAIRLIKPTISVPLLGFSGAPFTVATYLLDAGHRGNPQRIRVLMQDQPDLLKSILEQLADATAEYLDMQINAGVDAVQIFDSWASVLSDAERREFCYPYLKKVLQAVKARSTPVILFARGSSRFYGELAQLNPHALSIDEGKSLKEIRRDLPRMPLQGNLAPEDLLLPREELGKRVHKLLEEMDKDPGFIFNLGHGILPQTPFSNVRYLAECVTTWQPVAKSIK